MQKMLILPALAAITLGLSQGALAQNQDGARRDRPPECRQDKGRCVAPNGQPPHPGRHPDAAGSGDDQHRAPPQARGDAPRGERMQKHGQSRDIARNGAEEGRDHDTQTRRHTPRPGDDARGSQPFRRTESSGIAAPGKGQELRVIDDAVVLIDSRTQRVQNVLGAVPVQR